MPRLRQVQKQKYGELSGDLYDYIDTDKQDEIIENLKKRADFTNSSHAKKVFRFYLILIGIINLILITFPTYRKKGNSVFSFLACIMIFIPAVLAYSMIYKLSSEYLKIFKNVKMAQLSLTVYIGVVVSKFLWFANNIGEDLIYVLPILLGYLVIEIWNDNSKISQAIQELDGLKYDYKEA